MRSILQSVAVCTRKHFEMIYQVRAGSLEISIQLLFNSGGGLLLLVKAREIGFVSQRRAGCRVSLHPVTSKVFPLRYSTAVKGNLKNINLL